MTYFTHFFKYFVILPRPCPAPGPQSPLWAQGVLGYVGLNLYLTKY